MQQIPKQNKTARKRIEEQQQQRRERERWGREARDTKGQNFETSNNNAIYVCDAIAAVAAAVHHMHIAYKTIDEAHFIVTQPAVLAICAADGIITGEIAHFDAKDPRYYKIFIISRSSY